jgi:hypothetical protein
LLQSGYFFNRTVIKFKNRKVKMTILRLQKYHMALALSAVLAACGGSGGSVNTNTSTSPDTPVQADAQPADTTRLVDGPALRPPSDRLKAELAANAGQFSETLAAGEFVTSVQVCWSGYIDSISLTTNTGRQIKKGGPGGACNSFALQAGDSIMRIWGERGRALETLNITTTQGRTYGVYSTSHTQTAFSQTIAGGVNGTFSGFNGAVGVVDGNEVLTALNIIGADAQASVPCVQECADTQLSKMTSASAAAPAAAPAAAAAESGLPFADRLPPDESVEFIKTCWDIGSYVRSVQLRTNKGWRPRQGAAGGQCDTSRRLRVGEFVSDIVTPTTTVRHANGTSSTYMHAISYFTSMGEILGPYGNGGGVVTTPHVPQMAKFAGWYGRYGSQWLERIELMAPTGGNDGANIFQDVLATGRAVKTIRICTGQNGLKPTDLKLDPADATGLGVYYQGKTVVRLLQAIDGVPGPSTLGRHGSDKLIPGRPAPSCQTVTLQAGEHIVEMSGTSITEDSGAPLAVASLQFRTNLRNVVGPFGVSTGKAAFTIPNPYPRFLGFAGHATQAGNEDGGTIIGIDFAGPGGYPIVPAPDATAAQMGAWGQMADWPLVGLHAAMLSDGRMMSYGTDGSGTQGAQFLYDIWDPSLGTGPASHTLLPNTLATDLFCSSQSLLPNGQLLLSGGDARDSGYNKGIRASSVFSPAQNALTAGSPMNYARWYGSQTVLNTGDVLMLGGSDDKGGAVQVPDLYNAKTKQWKLLTGAATAYHLGSYPRTMVTRSIYSGGGRAVWVLSPNTNRIYRLEIDGNNGTGEMIDVGVKFNDMPAGKDVTGEEDPDPRAYSWNRPVVQIAHNKVLVQLNSGKTKLVTLPNNGNPAEKPTVVDAGQLSQSRAWSEMVVLPTGDVLALNGSAKANLTDKVAYHAELWNSVTQRWSSVATQIRPRLYHSTALLQADGSVLSMGGGAPGRDPGYQNEMNAQIYRPPYLFTGAAAAARPSFTVVGGGSVFEYGKKLSLTTVAADVGKVTMVKLGSTTHSYNSEQRFLNIPFSVIAANRVDIAMTTGAYVASPGYYYLTVVNKAGVPSLSKIVRLDYLKNIS